MCLPHGTPPLLPRNIASELTELSSLENRLGHLFLVPAHDEGLAGEHLGLAGIFILGVDHHGARAARPIKERDK